jgi:hypothetical protein
MEDESEKTREGRVLGGSSTKSPAWRFRLNFAGSGMSRSAAVSSACGKRKSACHKSEAQHERGG